MPVVMGARGRFRRPVTPALLLLREKKQKALFQTAVDFGVCCAYQRPWCSAHPGPLAAGPRALHPEENASAFSRTFFKSCVFLGVDGVSARQRPSISKQPHITDPHPVCAIPGRAVPLGRQPYAKMTTTVDTLENRKSCDPAPPFTANRGTCLCCVDRYPYFYVRLPV